MTNKDYFLSKSITINDVKNLYRYPVYIAVNTFLERLVRVNYDRQIEIYEYKNEIKNIRYADSYEVTFNYYHNIYLNSYLMKSLINIFKKDYKIKEVTDITLLKKQFFYKHERLNLSINLFQRIIKRFLKKFYFLFKILPSKIIFDNSKWLSYIFSTRSSFININNTIDIINYDFRNKYIQSFKQSLINNLDKIDFINLENNHISNSVFDLFAEWVEQSLPISSIENLENKYDHYLKYFKKNNFNEAHSTLDQYYNENYKIFLIILSHNKKPIYVHDHGVNNFIKYFQTEESNANFNKSNSAMYYTNYYIAWGKGKLVDQWSQVEKKYNLEIINSGSVYLGTFKKKNYSLKKNKKIKIFYPSSPYKEYMAGLDEITPEENYNHKLQVSLFIKKLIDKYNIEIIYKNFNSTPEIFVNDPIFKLLHKEINNGSVKLTKQHPTRIMKECDILLLDMLSTTFAEASVIGIPTIIFSNKFDYNIACKDGKKINNKFEKNNLLFYKVDDGINSFKILLKNYNYYKTINKGLFTKYQDLIAHPIKKKNFINQLNIIRKNNSNH